MSTRKPYVNPDLSPGETWDLWMRIIKHDKNLQLENGRKPIGSELTLTQKLEECGYFFAENRDPRVYGSTLAKIRKVFQGYGITEDSEIDLGGQVEERTNRREYLKNVKVKIPYHLRVEVGKER